MIATMNMSMSREGKGGDVERMAGSKVSGVMLSLSFTLLIE